MCLDKSKIDIGGSGFIKGQLKEIEIRFNPCEDLPGVVSCTSAIDFKNWFSKKTFYMWTAGNYLDPKQPVESELAVKQRIVYQLALGTTLGVRSEVNFEMNMAEVRTKHEGDFAFGYEKPESKIVQRYLNSQRTLQRESLLHAPNN